MCSGKLQSPFMNNYDAHKYIKTVRSPEQDEILLDQHPVLDLNNTSLSGALTDREGYDPVPQNITQNPVHIHIPNMVQDVKIGETIIRGPVEFHCGRGESVTFWLL